MDEFTSEIMEMLLERDDLLKRLEEKTTDLEHCVCYAALIRHEQRMTERIQKEIDELQMSCEQYRNKWLNI